MLVKDSVVVITGAASGIGEAAAIGLSALGAKIVLCDLNDEKLKFICERIEAGNGQACYKAANVTSETEVQAVMDFAIAQFGCINVVLACAGIIKDAFFVHPDKETGMVKKFMTTEQFQSVINVNLTGVFITLREAAIRMINNKWTGVLIPVSSINKAGELGQLNYASSKAAIALWPKILAGEFHARQVKNIRIAAIAPGYVATPMLTSIKTEILDGIISGIPIGRLVDTEEITTTIRFIIENEAIHGTTIEVSGGIIAKGLAK